MSNMPSVHKSKISLQLDNEVIVALDAKAKNDGTSRNAVANYLLTDSLQKLIDSFTDEQKQDVDRMTKKNEEARNANH